MLEKSVKAGKYVIFAKIAGFLNPGVLETVTCAVLPKGLNPDNA